jgi:hypothetical protein
MGADFTMQYIYEIINSYYFVPPRRMADGLRS